MRDGVIFFMVLVAATLGYIVYSQGSALKDSQREIRALEKKLESKSKSESLELQEKCARQAAALFKADGWEKGHMAGFENHYNEKMNRCFILEGDTDPKTTPVRVYISETLLDAFEHKTLGSYLWVSDPPKKYWEAPPLQCEVTAPSGEKTVCKSSDEFDELVKVYMQ
jgi:hypothetical protein